MKTLASAARRYYLDKMRAFLPVKVRKQTATGEIEVGFTTYGNKHLHSDTFGRSKVFQKADLLILPELLRKSEYAKSASLSKARKDRIANSTTIRCKSTEAPLSLMSQRKWAETELQKEATSIQ